MLKGETGEDKIFYTTGRLTSEMVIKVAQMGGIPVLLSRSGATQMGYELAQKLGITMVARAKGHRFQVYNGKENLILDVKGENNQSLLIKSTSEQCVNDHQLPRVHECQTSRRIPRP